VKVNLADREAFVVGEGSVTEAVIAGLADNGARVRPTPTETDGAAPDILVLGGELRAEWPTSNGFEMKALSEIWAPRMVQRGGRIVFLLGAIGSLPIRRYREQSAIAAALVFHMRGLAMRFGPSVLVNAVGAGAIMDAQTGRLVAGAGAMLSHVPSGRSGSIADLVNAMLFLCDPLNSYMTGQVLTVDGGWSAGYGRNF
jgi:Enoyl-(Acyl carrier protein) reductase